MPYNRFHQRESHPEKEVGRPLWQYLFYYKSKQETLRVETIAIICSTLVLLWKFLYFRRPIYSPVKHLCWSFYCKNNKPLSIFTKKLHCRCSFGFLKRLCFLKTHQTFYFFKLFNIIRLLISVISLKYLASFNSWNIFKFLSLHFGRVEKTV